MTDIGELTGAVLLLLDDRRVRREHAAGLGVRAGEGLLDAVGAIVAGLDLPRSAGPWCAAGRLPTDRALVTVYGPTDATIDVVGDLALADAGSWAHQSHPVARNHADAAPHDDSPWSVWWYDPTATGVDAAPAEVLAEQVRTAIRDVATGRAEPLTSLGMRLRRAGAPSLALPVTLVWDRGFLPR